ncbi:elongation factor P [Patescibacteria group bacterium]|nr:elongation factor P [Patescibacteria group bacterium]
MASSSDIKKGTVLNHGDDLYVVTDFQFNKPGKGMAFTKTKMKSIATGKTIEVNFRSDEKIDVVEVYKVNMQFLYKNADVFSFMNQSTYETLDVRDDIIGNDAKYLKDGLTVIMTTFEDIPIAMELPTKIKYKVLNSPPAVKGDTASGNVTKTITLDNELEIQAPIFIKEGEEILVNTETGDYAGRVSE